MPSFLQITDTHIVADGTLAYGRSDTAAALERAVETINARLPLLGGVECAIVTGDLTDHGSEEEYDRFKAIMSRLQLPYLAIPGNHDLRGPMRVAFAGEDWMPMQGPIQWRRDIGALTVIGLDTLLEGAHYGHLSDAGFAFLDSTLSSLGPRPAVIATHHPWMLSGIDAMDQDNLRNGARLIERLQAHPGPVRMISGHVHRAITGQIGKVTCQIGPAPCHAVHLDHRRQAENALILEPGAVTVYCQPATQPGLLISDLLPVGSFAGPWPFFP
ncbi:phosphodiesterase [Pseudodonghicola flavimaris]|uniref:Phosphodiesterase n=1 Tax=Pseudodonghicola flavimaris TaxID=3050036 RepID=A0ABT7EVX4_9RHOB|nr:phosphodiesterase [Pseudodonghicola flavimaris]MDK3016498.1 phosphodiesterase [Pseudodonghicola flavimaris]